MTENLPPKRQAKRRAWFRFRKRLAACNMGIKKLEKEKKQAYRKWLAEKERIYSGGEDEVRAEDLHALWQDQ